MNLAAYDKIGAPSTKSKIYMSNTYPYIITREIPYRRYYCFVKRYEPSNGINNLFLVLLDDKPDDRQVAKVRRDNYGRLKFNLSQVRDYINLNRSKEMIVKFSLQTKADDGDIYNLELESD